MSQLSSQINNNDTWYLGIDFGTISLAAVLLNSKLGRQYPIYWSFLNQQGSEESSFLLPTMAYCAPSGQLESNQEKLFTSTTTLPLVIGTAASKLTKEKEGIFLEKFKPYLNIAIPYYSSKQHQWEPQLQSSGEQLISLYSIQQALQALFATLASIDSPVDSDLTIGATDLSEESLKVALANLQGVILNFPEGWSDAYQFNLREALLHSKLVEHPAQIFFIEEAIASLLGNLLINENQPKSLQSSVTTLVINAGATTTELALVNLPNNPQKLTYTDFTLHSFAYGGDDLEEDILYQLIYPQWMSQFNLSLAGFEIDIPRPGEPDSDKRNRASLHLQSSNIGRSLLDTAKLVKLILQKRQEFTSQLGNQQWRVKRQDLEVKVIGPFLEHFNHQLNLLLSKTDISEQMIAQVVCSGEVMSTVGGMLFHWLRQKLPNATLIQQQEDEKTSRVAIGLASVPLFPSVLNQFRHQYSDYFLFRELLKAIPNESFSVKQIMHRLRERGINTQICFQRLLTFLKGELPIGLIPNSSALNLLSPTSQQNPEYQAIASTPLFFTEDNQCYRPNFEQCQYLLQYLAVILSDREQKLTEPLVFNLAVAQNINFTETL